MKLNRLAHCFAMFLTCGLLSTIGWAQALAADDEEFSAYDLITGKRTSKAECEATTDAVWVSHAKGTDCIRYFASSSVKGAKVAALFFHGDRLDGRSVIPGAQWERRPSTVQAEVEGLSKVNQVPYIFVARPGVFCSSGWHVQRRTPKEYLSLNAAVDAIKAKYGLERVYLGGQSGGAAAVGALLTLGRTDVVCAIASSGPYDALARARDINAAKGLGPTGCDVTGYCDPYNVTDHVETVAASDLRRIFIVGDPNDTNTLFKYQKAFAEKLKSAGHDVTLVEATGRGAMHHGLAHLVNRALGWCHAGFETSRIAELIHTDAYGLNDIRGQTK
jgi:hypothetical protein